MCKIETSVIIQAPPKVVWSVLTDFKSYPQWNPFLTRVEQVDEKNLIIEITSGKSKTVFKPTILKMESSKEFRWLGKLAGISGLFTGEHYFILKKEKAGTLLIHGENFSGILTWLLWPFIKRSIQNNFIKMNVALKLVLSKKSS